MSIHIYDVSQLLKNFIMINLSDHLYVNLSGYLLDQTVDQVSDGPEEFFWDLQTKVDQPSLNYYFSIGAAWLTET